MSDHIPVEIQLEIMSRLPVKSLIRFRSVSKTWKSTIDSSDFIVKHYNNRKVQHLLVTCLDTVVGFSDLQDKYVSILDDHTFPNHKESLTPPLLVRNIESPRVIGSSHGLVGLDSRNDAVVIWNISIRKAVVVSVPNGNGGRNTKTALGFGVCRETNDPKIVKITYVEPSGVENATCNPTEVEVFTFSTGAWRRSYGNLPSHIIIMRFIKDVLLIDGVIYWVAIGKVAIDDNFADMLISFDLTSEEFREVTLPHGSKHVYISKLGESLVVVGEDEHPDYDVWMMGDGVPKSFTKLFTFTYPKEARVLRFLKSGKRIIENREQVDDDRVQLAVYEPYSKHVNNIGIDGSDGTFAVCDYMETLFLLDQKDLMVMNDI